jgi:hypothetical protein
VTDAVVVVETEGAYATAEAVEEDGLRWTEEESVNEKFTWAN